VVLNATVDRNVGTIGGAPILVFASYCGQDAERVLAVAPKLEGLCANEVRQVARPQPPPSAKKPARKAKGADRQVRRFLERIRRHSGSSVMHAFAVDALW